MSKKIKVAPNQKEFLVLKFKELNISLSQFCRIYNVERTRRGSNIKKYLHLKFLAIKEVALANNYSIRFLCEILKVNRKSYYK